MNDEMMQLLGSLLGSVMAFFFVARMLRYQNTPIPRLNETKPPTQEKVADDVEKVREEAKTSASQKVETLTQEVKLNANDADAAAAALRDSQL